MQIFEDYKLGRTDDAVHIDNRKLNHLAITKMAQQCKRTIEIVSRELDPPFFDTEEFVEACKKMILANRNAKLRIIVFEPQAIVARGHRLLNLAGTLSSFFEFRKPDLEYSNFNEALFITDSTGYVHRQNIERFEGIVNFNDKRQSKYLLQKFDDIWEKSAPDSNMRQLHI
ncbi:MAG: hypothetical protein O6928_05540 [Gammaproteobacteria bacterium]|nr:hypothetical protein [Gammaproteobacteria bacterium]